jgi:hypothetical protein
MSVTRTFTVTVVSTGSGNKYFIDGVQQATLNLAENGTYKFDQSDSSNGNHPLRFSITNDGTHGGGSEYTTGVTTNGTPGQAGAYTQIVVAVSAPTLYYYCTNHPGMGGQANTVDDDTYGMWAWGTNEWGDQSPIVFTPTGVVATSSVGSVAATELIVVSLTGLPTTSSLGSLSLQINSTISLTGLQSQTELGTVDNAGTLVGWGRNGWSEEPWGDSFNQQIQPAGVQATSSVGSVVTAIGISLTGVSSTSSVGALSPENVMGLTGLSTTSSVGSVIAGTGVPLTGVSSTSSVGSILPADVVGLTGVSATASIGAIEVTETQIVVPTGVSTTSSVGSIVPAIGVPLTGVQATSAVGSISPSDVMGLTGLSTISSVGTLSIIGYKNIDITGNTSYTDVTHVA